jgi:hypothetical protein
MKYRFKSVKSILNFNLEKRSQFYLDLTYHLRDDYVASLRASHLIGTDIQTIHILYSDKVHDYTTLRGIR